MSNEYQVYCDYLKASIKANAIEKIADRIYSIGEVGVVEELQELNLSWKSDSMDIVKSKGYEINDELQLRAHNLKRIADVIRAIARRNYAAEMRALEIARTRGDHDGSGRHFGGTGAGGGGGGGGR